MSRNSTVDKMVAYMNEKYDDHFEYSAPFGGGPGATSVQITVSSERFPNAKIWVQYYEIDGKEIYADNYISYKYEEPTRSFLQAVLESVFHADVKVLYSVGSKGTIADFSEETSFEEYISSIEADIGFRAFVFKEISQDDFYNLENNLKRELRSNSLMTFGSIYFTTNEIFYENCYKLSQKELDTLYSLQFDMLTLDTYRYFDWRAG